jgi:hypothetical protein
MTVTMSGAVRFRIALSFLIETLHSSHQVLHRTLGGASYTVYILSGDPANITLRDRGLLQPGPRLFVFSRIDLTGGIALLQCLQCLVAP